jgi:DNA polymerase (family 10)
MTPDEIVGIRGIGTSTAGKISELLSTGRMQRFESYAARTPEGVRELLMIKGLGPSKVRAVWKDLGVGSPGELLYACNENRLVGLSGFGVKTQAAIREQLQYYMESRGKFLWSSLEPVATLISERLQRRKDLRFDWVGPYARKCPVVEALEAIVVSTPDLQDALEQAGCHVDPSGDVLSCVYLEKYPVRVYPVEEADYRIRKFELTADETFRDTCARLGTQPDDPVVTALPPELLEGPLVLERAIRNEYASLLDETDLKGVIHCHSTDSDGLNSVREMAEYAREDRFQYLVITDHSRSAVYANGLPVSRVREQWDEIERLNSVMAPFYTFKGIESDILSDGSLDYPDDLLAGFEVVIASIHSGLKMDEEKATRRLIRAIEHPRTSILGHPTGRLLLAREGYLVDHRKIIDACAANGVAIELNANPQRLDIDSRFLPYVIERGVMVSVNPDAHSRESIRNLRFGVYAARRGGLPRDLCLNALTVNEFSTWLEDHR